MTDSATPPPSPTPCVVTELRPPPDPAATLRRFSAQRGTLLLDSSARHPTLGRWSYLAVDPFEWVQADATGGGFDRLQGAWSRYRAPTAPGLPPFQGGAAGLFSYELGRELERVPAARHDEFRAPTLAVGLYDLVIAWDHSEDRCWVVSQGFPETDPAARRTRAEARAAWLVGRLEGPGPTHAAPPGPTLPAGRLAPQHPVDWRSGVTSDFSREGYLSAVRRAIDYIHAGDVFQVNLSQRLLAPLTEPVIDYYLRLRERSPATFAAFFNLGDWQVASASPERFLRVDPAGRVETRPIKGTRPRSGDVGHDLWLARELAQHPKDRAENTMIVDLLRNDLSRVCRDDSIGVPLLCGVESYAQVHHLVSVVEGTLRADRGPLDLLRASFPGGSITGAPKVRAMQVIAELCPTARGAYCGALGFLGFDGAMDTSVLIRTATACRGWLQMPVGGGVVADSRPEAEYDETRQKAEGMLRSLALSAGKRATAG